MKKRFKSTFKNKKLAEDYISEYPDTDYSLDLKFKLGLIQNQLAAKDLYCKVLY